MSVFQEILFYDLKIWQYISGILFPLLSFPCYSNALSNSPTITSFFFLTPSPSHPLSLIAPPFLILVGFLTKSMCAEYVHMPLMNHSDYSYMRRLETWCDTHTCTHSFSASEIMLSNCYIWTYWLPLLQRDSISYTTALQFICWKHILMVLWQQKTCFR